MPDLLDQTPAGFEAHIMLAVRGVISEPGGWDGLLHLSRRDSSADYALCGQHIFKLPVRADWKVMEHDPEWCPSCWSVATPSLPTGLPVY